LFWERNNSQAPIFLDYLNTEILKYKKFSIGHNLLKRFDLKGPDLRNLVIYFFTSIYSTLILPTWRLYVSSTHISCGWNVGQNMRHRIYFLCLSFSIVVIWFNKCTILCVALELSFNSYINWKHYLNLRNKIHTLTFS
jgi:hypothetical protein